VKHYDSFEAWLDDQSRWGPQALEYRRIALACGLEEGIKWGQPCYMDRGKNVAIIAVFKADCGLTFFKGALVDDPKDLLVGVGPNARSGRIFRCSELDRIRAHEDDLRALIASAVANQRAGLKVPRPTAEELEPVEELTERLAADPVLAAAWEALTPGRRRGYLHHFSGAKRSATRAARIERVLPKILAGKGMQDCVCGRSKRPPRCDGSHKHA